MKIGILGTRGIPNHYGGFEQFAEYLSVGLVKRGHAVLVYNSSTHPFQEQAYEGVEIIHCFDPEDKIGTAGQFIYDLNCIRDARGRSLDILLQLGYTSSSVWGPWLPEDAIVFTNMDGLEWKRSKYNKWVKQFLKKAEYWAIKTSDELIADSLGIQDYLKSKYGRRAAFIAYGAELFQHPKPELLSDWNLKQHEYYLLIARMEPENNIEMILDGYAASGDQHPFLVVGKTDNGFAKEMIGKFKTCAGVRFTGGIYETELIDNLRHFSRLYFHGHSVGGTNPSLLEAMGAGALIAANDNPFNRSVLEDEAFYFNSAEEVRTLLQSFKNREDYDHRINKNRQKIASEYKWERIIDQYESLFENHHLRKK